MIHRVGVLTLSQKHIAKGEVCQCVIGPNGEGLAIRRLCPRIVLKVIHQATGEARIRNGVRPERDGGHTPLHRVLFNVVNVSGAHLDLPGVRAEVAAPAAAATTRFDLQWAFAEDGDAVTGVLEYDTELFEAATAERMASQFAGVLEHFVDAPERRVSTLELMSATQESLALAFNEPL